MSGLVKLARFCSYFDTWLRNAYHAQETVEQAEGLEPFTGRLSPADFRIVHVLFVAGT